jgi:hypothetical protein
MPLRDSINGTVGGSLLITVILLLWREVGSPCQQANRFILGGVSIKGP